jgi:hypothetical protein
MGGGEHGVCGRHTCVLVRFGRWQGVYQVTKGVAFPPPPLRPRARSSRPRRDRGSAVDRYPAARPGARERDQRSSLAPGLACARAGVHLGARASGSRGHTREREREHEQHGAASRTRAARRSARRREEQAKPECERALTKAAAPANDSTQPGTMAGITSGGAER